MQRIHDLADMEVQRPCAEPARR